MKNVTMIRQRVTRDLLKLRSFISMLDGNVDVVDRMHGEQGEMRISRMVAFILTELGHEEEHFNRRGGEPVQIEAATSVTRRALKKAQGATVTQD